MKALKFNCYDEFACTGPVCEDSCCKHWRIHISKREYLDYKKMDCSPELKAVVNSAFKRTRSDSDMNYAIMSLKEDGSCPFLNEDRLCMIQKEMGESALSLTCSSFPRNWILIGNDAAVFTLTPTCYHVVELLMKHPEGLMLTEDEYDGTNRWINKGTWTSRRFPLDAKILPYIWTIKNAQLDILQNREFTVSERMLILGYYTQRVCDYLDNSPEKIAQLGAMMLDKELCRKIADSLKTPQTEDEAAARSMDILYIMVEGLRSGVKGKTDPQTMERLNIIGNDLEIGYAKNEEGQKLLRWNTEAYAKNRELFRKIEEERPYILENLLVNIAFGNNSQDSKELWADYFSLAVLYNVLKTGMAAFLPESFTDFHIAMAITNVVKIILNAKIGKAVIMDDFARNNANSLPYVAFLIS